MPTLQAGTSTCTWRRNRRGTACCARVWGASPSSCRRLALIALLNAILGLVPVGGGQHLSLQWIFGRIGAPLAWLMGVPWKDSLAVGNLLGTRLVLNELIAYTQLGPLKASLDPRSFVIATFALCGFANLGSIAIQIGGIGSLAPDRKHDLALLGFRAVAAGSLANFLSACIAGMLL